MLLQLLVLLLLLLPDFLGPAVPLVFVVFVVDDEEELEVSGIVIDDSGFLEVQEALRVLLVVVLVPQQLLNIEQHIESDEDAHDH